MAVDSGSNAKVEIAHVLTMDVVEYSTLLITEQSRIMAELKRIVRETARFRHAEAEKKLICLPTGDGMALVFFTDHEAPIECAMEVSAAIKNRPEIRLRMGIHSGPVDVVLDVNERANVAGAGIDMAQRVMDCGDAGHILLSKRVADDLAPFPRWNPHLHDLGECEVKHGRKVSLVNFFTDELGNSQRPLKLAAKSAEAVPPPTPAAAATSWRKPIVLAGFLLLFATLGVLVWRFSHTASLGPAATLPILEKSIAVLPFENLSEDKANAYFANGIQDEILTRLAKIGTLKVISRTSTERYKTAPANISEIAKQLGVAHLLEGSVQKADKQVRVNVQLIKADDGSHLWAETYDRNLNDIFSVESEVATAIAEKLQAALTGSEQRALANRPTENLDAYDAYLRGVEFDRRMLEWPANQLEAERYLKLAVSLDPKFALAWARLAKVETTLYFGDYEPTPARREAARNAAEQATKLQPELGESWIATGYYRSGCERNLELARAAFEKARERLPNDSEVLRSLGWVVSHSGRPDDAMALLAQAIQFDPRNASLVSERADYFVSLRRFPEARAAADQALTLSPQSAQPVMLKAVTFQAEGDLARANQLFASISGSLIATNYPGQARQLLLERRYRDVISTLRPTLLAERNPSVVFSRDISAWLLGTAQKLSGDLNGSQSTFAQQRDALLREMEKTGGPQGGIHCILALMYAGAGDKTNALREAHRGLELEGNDTYFAAAAEEVLALIEVETGDAAAALARLPRLLNAHYYSWLFYAPLTPALLRIDPVWDPIRNDPRFQKLVEEKKP
jgi:TolB-like protein/class 3 adenylate cyclase/Tfp pilus assembly protein PilF